MSYYSMSDLAQADPATDRLMTRPEFDRMTAIEATGVPHEQAKQLIYDARKTGVLPPIPEKSLVKLVISDDVVVWATTWIPRLIALGAVGYGVVKGAQHFSAKTDEASLDADLEKTGSFRR